MTERKPSGMSFTSWIDQQISEAAERGAFDNLHGAGKPLPNRPDDDGQGWLREYVRREGLSAEELLPPPLRLRKESARLVENVAEMDSEQEVRVAVSELNRRIAEWRRIPVGPPIFVPMVDRDEMVRRWQAAHPPRSPVPHRPDPLQAGRPSPEPPGVEPASPERPSAELPRAEPARAEPPGADGTSVRRARAGVTETGRWPLRWRRGRRSGQPR
jgi:hypothetical protein